MEKTNLPKEEGERKTLSDMMIEMENGYKQYKEVLADLHLNEKIAGTVFIVIDRNADQMLEDAKEKVLLAKKSLNTFDVNLATGYVEALIEWFNKPLMFPED